MIRFSTAALASAAAFVLAGMAAPALQASRWQIVRDPQAVSCLPWSMYVEHLVPPTHLRKGQIVVLREGAVSQAAYLNPGLRKFASAPAGKMIAAIPGDTIEERDGQIWVDGEYMGRAWLQTWVSRHFHELSVPWKPGKPYVVPTGEVMVMGTRSLAFDSRYFGLVKAGQIFGTAYPL